MTVTTSRRRTPTVPVPQAARDQLRQAAESLAEAHRCHDPLARYPAAYLAALRAAAAVLAGRGRPRPRRGRNQSVWFLLADAAPELAEWAAYFAACSTTRAAAEAGIVRLVSQRDADEVLRQAERFVEMVGDIVAAR